MIITNCLLFLSCLAVINIDISLASCCFKKTVSGCDSTLPLLKIDFPQKTVYTCEPNFVNDRAIFQTAPEISFSEADPNSFYTLIMEDPDAPNHLEGEAWLHWIVANISGSSLALGDIYGGVVVTPYKPPNPPKGSGAHRYLTYVFGDPPAVANSTPLYLITNRRAFKIKDYACERGLCGPLAYGMFRSQHHSE